MFDWIPFAVASVVLLWALASFRHAVSGSQRAGLHEIIAPAASAAAPGARGGRVAAILLAVIVLIAAIALFAYAVFAA